MELKLTSERGPNNHLEELAELAKTAGADVVSEVVQIKDSPCASTYIGKGKAYELKEEAERVQADIIIFNNNLTGSQARNLEAIVNAKIIDRTELILDIFAQRARTREAKLQVELAQLKYSLPRLTGKGVALSRLGGGIGTRGPGETKLEYDRRRIRNRITHLKKEMQGIVKERKQQRAKRKEFVVCSLVGYTNAGKSTLLNTFTSAGVRTEDRLFATLDPTTRGFILPNNQKILLVDTVGFIQNLPHDLVSSFAATLEEVQEADILLHVVDASSPWMEGQIDAVNKVLEQLNVISKPILIVLNKIDRLEDDKLVRRMLKRIPNSVAISALYNRGLEKLFAAMMDLPPLRLRHFSVAIPANNGRLYTWLKREGNIESCRYEGDRFIIDVGLTDKKIAYFKKLRSNAPTG